MSSSPNGCGLGERHAPRGGFSGCGVVWRAFAVSRSAHSVGPLAASASSPSGRRQAGSLRATLPPSGSGGNAKLSLTWRVEKWPVKALPVQLCLWSAAATGYDSGGGVSALRWCCAPGAFPSSVRSTSRGTGSLAGGIVAWGSMQASPVDGSMRWAGMEVGKEACGLRGEDSSAGRGGCRLGEGAWEAVAVDRGGAGGWRGRGQVGERGFAKAAAKAAGYEGLDGAEGRWLS